MDYEKHLSTPKIPKKRGFILSLLLMNILTRGDNPFCANLKS
ncbi:MULTISPECIES: hypothetical protein [Petrimonas]|uniref:Uncharacterized protein n=1 Tax=Petrimonas mucosa TaxID=1642646 RepID=A0A1G4G5J2_9BACT|nr:MULTISPECIES: hypothetical protein [Petrimonas]MDD3560933.1 hypothetical protein [Petrimonas mucosa]SCM56558.1 hypothetical protein ING2E5A_0936 [Petrimonas mucosa]